MHNFIDDSFLRRGIAESRNSAGSRQWRFYLETYGCKVNQYESQSIREAWLGLGGLETDEPGVADYILINSCAITSRAERDSRNAIYRLKRQSPGATVILTGCAAQLFPQFEPRKNGVHIKPDICVPQSQKKFLLLGPRGGDCNCPAWSIRDFRRARPVIKIQDGCSQNCTYCIVPQTRGRPQSRSPHEIMRECESLIEKGFYELIISGVNLRQYGQDQPRFGNFWSLLKFLDKELGHGQQLRLRISSIEPAQLSQEALETLAGANNVCHHVHLSLQHASPPILKMMGRGHYHPDSILEWLEKLRRFWPVAGLGADIIAGFPGESEADLQMLLRFIGEAGLTYAHIFPFSARPGTPASRFPGQIEKKEKLRRAALAREAARAGKSAFLRRLLSLDKLIVTPDLAGTGSAVKGICEFYATCLFMEPVFMNGRRYVTATPLSIKDDLLLVTTHGKGEISR